MNPFISIIIPAFNTEDTIVETLDSIFAQTLQDIEVICVDDCSTDNTQKVIDGYQQKHNRVHYFRMDKNSGAGPCRNVGMQKAKGEFIAFMDSDDLYASHDCLENMYKAAKDKNVLIAGGNMQVFENDLSNAQPWGKGEFEDNYLYDYADYPYSHGYTRFIYKREFILQNNLFFPPLRRYQDPVWFSQVMVAAKTFYGMNIPVYAYRKAHQNIIYTAEKTGHVLDGMTRNLKLFCDNNLPNHYKNEEREMKNFIFRAVYGSLLQGLEFQKIIKTLNQHISQSDYIQMHFSDIFHFVKIGLIILKNKARRALQL
jgi:glycosyltransferase involved in cell wall biosynthesis